ncbi:helix-turn-helix domain-containing protein [Kocuria sp. CPCC 205292]
MKEMDTGTRGRKRRLVLEDEYWALIFAGVGTRETCPLVRIGRKTGYRWRAELGVLAPVRSPAAQTSERYLSLLKLKRIGVLCRRGLSIREIATRLGRAPSTISRELRRNTAEHDHEIYRSRLGDGPSRSRGSLVR